MALELAGLRIWDGVSDSLRPGLESLHVSGETIAAGPNGGERIDLRGCVALPGLFDAHVHFTLDPERPEAGQTTSESLPEMEARALAMLQAGITTARDLGGPHFGALELRDRIARGESLGPRILCAGQPLTSPKGHCW